MHDQPEQAGLIVQRLEAVQSLDDPILTAQVTRHKSKLSKEILPLIEKGYEDPQAFAG